jgi:hypothetical protein
MSKFSPAAGTERFTSASPRISGFGLSCIAAVATRNSSRSIVHRLVHVETFASPLEAIAREKPLKNWHRDWKTQLIIENNPDWSDLSHLL